jgi:hypothetical protein
VYLVEVTDDLVEDLDDLDAVLGDGVLAVKVPEVGDGGKHNANAAVALVVQLLQQNKSHVMYVIQVSPRLVTDISSVLRVQEMIRHVCRKDVFQKDLVQRSDCLHILSVNLELTAPDEIQLGGPFDLRKIIEENLSAYMLCTQHLYGFLGEDISGEMNLPVCQ